MRKIAIICGGYSGEYEISISSAKVVKSHLDSTVYDSYVIVIKKGEWYCSALVVAPTEVPKRITTMYISALDAVSVN